MTDQFTRDEVEVIASDAASRAVAAVFEKLDIDVSDKESLRKFRDNLRYLGEQHEGSIMLKQNLKKSAVYLMFTAAIGIVYFSWDIFKSGLLSWLQSLVDKQ